MQPQCQHPDSEYVARSSPGFADNRDSGSLGGGDAGGSGRRLNAGGIVKLDVGRVALVDVATEQGLVHMRVARLSRGPDRVSWSLGNGDCTDKSVDCVLMCSRYFHRSIRHKLMDRSLNENL